MKVGDIIWDMVLNREGRILRTRPQWRDAIIIERVGELRESWTSYPGWLVPDGCLGVREEEPIE